MLFSEPIFLFFFLPAVLGLYFLLPRILHNPMLLVASLFFYGWGEPRMFFLLPVSILLNWWFGIRIAKQRDARQTRDAKQSLIQAVVLNLGILLTVKYADFFVENLNIVLGRVGVPEVPAPGISLPIGVSFFTFQAMSYVIDVYRGDSPACRSLLALATWKSFFPQLIAGPIVRYNDLRDQLGDHRATVSMFAQGVERFIIGLAKKMIIANTAAATADRIFALPPDELTAGTAWLGAVCYALQIYFDFSGYSDMAIGLCRMFGFRIKENFNYPYAARSVTDFWRRWHISLSTWFRDYLYIPLGGNCVSSGRVYLNLLIVFVLCGFWHGASWAFIVWGLFHGTFLVVERMGLGRVLERAPSLICRAYTLLAVLVGWVFFRAETPGNAVHVLRAMAGLSDAPASLHPASLYLDLRLVVVMACGVIGSGPFVPWLKRLCSGTGSVAAYAGVAALGGLFLISAMLMAADTYNPFIYFRF